MAQLTPKIWGWTGLTAVSVVAVYYVKTSIDDKRRENMRARRAGNHMQVQEYSGTKTEGTDPSPGRTDLNTTFPGQPASAKMRSEPTGVDTPQSGPSSQEER